MWKGSVGSCQVWLGAAWVSLRDSGPGLATCSAPACIPAEISASVPGEPGLGKLQLEPQAPRASLHGPACCRGSRSSEDAAQLPADGGCFLLGPLWLQGGSASMALTWTGRGAGPLPLGRDRETVQGADQTADPQRLDCAPRVSPCTRLPQPGGAAYPAPQVLWTAIGQ